jgi:hypothetical protein
MKIRSMISTGLYLIRLLLSLFILWLTLGWRVRKARKAFEEQLICQGMAKSDAKRLSAQFSKLKDEMMSSVKGSMFRWH